MLAVLHCHSGESRKINKNNQAARAPAPLLLRLVGGLSLPLGHWGPALARCPGHALGEPLFSQVPHSLSLQRNEEMFLVPTPFLAPGTGQSSLHPPPWGCPVLLLCHGLGRLTPGPQGTAALLCSPQTSSSASPSSFGLRGAAT